MSPRPPLRSNTVVHNLKRPHHRGRRHHDAGAAQGGPDRAGARGGTLPGGYRRAAVAGEGDSARRVRRA